jgi:hypothetical protein
LAQNKSACSDEVKNLFPCVESNPSHPDLSLVTILTELSGRIVVASQYRINFNSCFTFATRLTVTSVKLKCENLFPRDSKIPSPRRNGLCIKDVMM